MIGSFVTCVGHLVLLVNPSWFAHGKDEEVGNAHRILVVNKVFEGNARLLQLAQDSV
jgi:hypothetical protein